MCLRNLSQLKTCLEAANNFLLSEDAAQTIFTHLTATIEQHRGAVCEEAELGEVDRKLFWGRQFLNPYSQTRNYSKISGVFTQNTGSTPEHLKPGTC